ncbi:MAG: zinc-binding dehydrogenase [Chloroflexi bacterium]|nr:zinc-binding dehydrogenase [Chloroflexota bacterium]MCI0769695.1 zinc-binding dehydrogenase [Chloroflexota bacterium]
MADTGRAAVFVGPNKPFELRDYPIPKLEPGSMLVKIAMSNICGSDLHIFRGDMASAGFDGSREAILGHEMAGRVYALGEGAGADSLGRPVKEGDRIVYQYFQPCWSCPVCLSGVTRACPNKSGRTSPVGEWPYFTGGYGEYYYVPPGRKLFKVEDDRIPDGLIASVNCAFSQVTQGWETVGLRFGQSAVVQGAGGLGLFATVVAKEIGAAPIIVIDAIESRLALAREFGADHTINTNEVKTPEERVAQVQELTGGLGAEVVAELVGFPAVVQEGWDMLRPGGRYLEIGNINRGMTMSYDPSQLVFGNKSVHGVVLYEPRIMPQVLDFISRNLTKYPFDKVVSHVFPLDKIDDAFQQAEWLGKQQEKIVRAALAP